MWPACVGVNSGTRQSCARLRPLLLMLTVQAWQALLLPISFARPRTHGCPKPKQLVFAVLPATLPATQLMAGTYSSCWSVARGPS